MFREAYPGLPSYKQDSLYHHLLGGCFNAHDAREDVASLQQLFSRKSPDNVLQYTFSFNYIIDIKNHNKITKDNFISWEPLVKNLFISKGMAEKAAGRGLQLCHVHLAYTRQGIDGVESVMSEITRAATGIRLRLGF